MRSGPRPGVLPLALAACVLLAAASLLFPHTLAYDPWAWMVCRARALLRTAGALVGSATATRFGDALEREQDVLIEVTSLVTRRP